MITSLCFTNDDEYLVIGVENEHIEIYSINKKSTITQEFDQIRIFTVACSPVDSNRFVVGGG